ncbi:MAG: sigma 54-interacting transcriptional regulator [Bryobacterales bacterium]|nr:sigma 54-interacting transcriptional regulator [Bryobacterales bacterium]
MAASPQTGNDQKSQKLATILRICEKMSEQRDVSALLDLVAREATLLLDADRSSIFILDRERNELWSKVALGSDEILRFSADKGIAGACTSTGQVINVRDAYNDRRFNSEIDIRTGYRTRNLLAMPLEKSDGTILGAFEVLNKRRGTFHGEDEEVLRILAAQAATAIETTKFIGDLTRTQEELAIQNAQLWREVESRPHHIVGNSPQIQQILRLVERIQDSTVNVLIGGESGTGKEAIARAIHFTSLRARKPFIALNCAALPENLLESELFGIERGVATGVQPRMGHFQAADGGTLFLDEIGDLSLTAQAKILRVLQERVVERVGGRVGVPVDVRILSASNKNLEEEIRQNRFREDLYYRLKVIHIVMPSLRDIREDVPLLANHFLDAFAREHNKGRMQFSPGLMRRLMDNPWPGNVRQLQNEVRRLVVCARRPVITEDDLFEGLPQGLQQPIPAPAPVPVAAKSDGRPRTLKSAVEDLERQMIEQTLASANGNQQRAAKMLGLSRQGLINKMKRFGLS